MTMNISLASLAALVGDGAPDVVLVDDTHATLTYPSLRAYVDRRDDDMTALATVDGLALVGAEAAADSPLRPPVVRLAYSAESVLP